MGIFDRARDEAQNLAQENPDQVSQAMDDAGQMGMRPDDPGPSPGQDSSWGQDASQAQDQDQDPGWGQGESQDSNQYQ